VNDDFALALSRDRVNGQFGVCVCSISSSEARDVDNR
jgi:mRNA-degrading endonuclease toxin of MazEF toxin-antitoxin module